MASMDTTDEGGLLPLGDTPALVCAACMQMQGPAVADLTSVPVHCPSFSCASERDERMQNAMAAAAAAGVKLQPSPEVLELIRSADAFTFDVDSTL